MSVCVWECVCVSFHPKTHYTSCVLTARPVYGNSEDILLISNIGVNIYLSNTHTHTHTYIYIYMYVCACVYVGVYMCMCVYVFVPFKPKTHYMTIVPKTRPVNAKILFISTTGVSIYKSIYIYIYVCVCVCVCVWTFAGVLVYVYHSRPRHTTWLVLLRPNQFIGKVQIYY